MPRGASTHFVRSEKGGLERDPSSLSSHKMLGITDEAFMRSAVTVSGAAHREGSSVVVTVRIINDRTGHHVPTDSPLRHLILLVRATGADGQALAQTDGPTVPEWGGVGDPADGYLAGLAGTAYAKVLQEFRSQLSPTGAYWNPTRIVSDNRIPALGTDTTRYSFDARESGAVTVDVTLLFRRAFVELAGQKGWPNGDLVMHHESIRVMENR
jgi:hypothetical protein